MLWMTQLDLSAIYAFEWRSRSTIELRTEVFNVFDCDRATETNEFAEWAPQNYCSPQVYRQLRYARFGAKGSF